MKFEYAYLVIRGEITPHERDLEFLIAEAATVIVKKCEMAYRIKLTTFFVRHDD